MSTILLGFAFKVLNFKIGSSRARKLSFNFCVLLSSQMSCTNYRYKVKTVAINTYVMNNISQTNKLQYWGSYLGTEILRGLIEAQSWNNVLSDLYVNVNSNVCFI